MVSKSKPYVWSIQAAYYMGLFPITMNSNNNFSLKYGPIIRIPYFPQFSLRLGSMARTVYSISQFISLFFLCLVLPGFIQVKNLDKYISWPLLIPSIISISYRAHVFFNSEELCSVYNSFFILDKEIREL